MFRNQILTKACKALFISILVLIAVGQVRAQSADQIINRYLQALGGHKKLKAIKTLRLTGKYEEGGSSFGTYIEWKRPNFRVVVVGIPDEVYREGFDGTSWEYSGGKVKVTEPSSEAGKTARRGAEFDESIVDYRKKGHRVEFIGQEKLNDSDVYHLRVILNDGWVKDYYLDTKTYLITGLRKAMPLHTVGPDIESLSMYEDYKPVAGVLFPHSFVQRNIKTGKVMNTLHWERIEANVKIDKTHFSPPKSR
jgi:hypothetical protein